VEYNLKAYAHRNRLGGVSYFTDADGELVTYNEFDAWGAPYTVQPEDANYSGLDVLTGFTGYTYDAVLDVYFAQARLYDFANRRFSAADPVAGDISVPISLNPYLYCQNDPLNNIDPTGAVMPGDENLSAQKQAEISVFTQQWDAANAAGDRAGMDAAHAGADAVRNRQESSPGSAGNSGNNGNGAYSAAYYQWQIIMAMLPPTNFSILVEEIAKFVPTLTLSEVLKTASEWAKSVNIKMNKSETLISTLDSIAIGDYITLANHVGSKTFDIGKGWTMRVEQHGSGPGMQKHVVLIDKSGKEYAQNDDGSPHDKPSSPPNSIKKAIKKGVGKAPKWDWDKLENDWLGGIEVTMDAGLSYYKIEYPDGKVVEVVQNIPAWPYFYYSAYPANEQLKEYYFADGKVDRRTTSVARDGSSDSVVAFPIIEPVPIPIPAPVPFPVPIV
jgi:RHS repeat-associated protein